MSHGKLPLALAQLCVAQTPRMALQQPHRPHPPILPYTKQEKKKNGKKKTQQLKHNPRAPDPAAVVSILTAISNRSKAKPDSTDYPLQNPSIGVTKRKDQTDWLRQTVISVPMFINTYVHKTEKNWGSVRKTHSAVNHNGKLKVCTDPFLRPGNIFKLFLLQLVTG